MAQSLSNILLHIIVSTKGRRPIITEQITAELYSYIGGIFKSQNCMVIKIGGYVDHIHILTNLSRTISISALVESFKSSSSKWIKAKGSEFESFYWQNGYGAFSVSQSNLESVVSYIENQHEHHKQINFMDEFRSFLNKHEIVFDENYIWS